MKTATLSVLTLLASLAATVPADAAERNSRGSHFEIHIKMVSYRQYGPGNLIPVVRWVQWDDNYEDFSDAEEEFDFLAGATEDGKLEAVVDLDSHGRETPAGVRLIYVVFTGNDLQPTEDVIIDQVEAP
jgi:hypothetical protein